MSSVSRVVAWLSLVLTVVPGNWASAQNAYAPQAGEFSLSGALPGDQVFPHAAIHASGGYVVWQDNLADGDGWGICAQALNNNLSGTLATFRVNQVGAGHQQNPRVALLQNGGAVFVWQGGQLGFQKIFARFLGADGVFATGDIMVNTYTNEQQINASVAVLADGNVVVTWGSFGQDGSLQGVFAQRLTPAGQKLGGEFQVNQSALYNQRTPSVAALATGNFVITWVSESFLGVDAQGQESFGVDIYARLYDPTGRALGDEFKVNSSANTCANPSVSGSVLGGFTVAWSQLDGAVRTNSWDVWARAFDGGGAALASEVRVNAFTYGDQFAPQIETLGTDQLVVWTSLGQDGSREGVYGRLMTSRGDLNGGEFRVNTTTRDSQMHPVVASDGQ
ncbi:MAG: hypothetical protein HY300_08920, partial [Verrucomicrobia bacterium]|nr:hypothetical protein [Verrucomicrobiota bacterium]